MYLKFLQLVSGVVRWPIMAQYTRDVVSASNFRSMGKFSRKIDFSLVKYEFLNTGVSKMVP